MLFYGPQLGGWGWLPGLSFLVFWALLAVIIFALARSFTRSGRAALRAAPGLPQPAGTLRPGPWSWAGAAGAARADPGRAVRPRRDR